MEREFERETLDYNRFLQEEIYWMELEEELDLPEEVECPAGWESIG